MIWHQTEEAQAILAQIVANPPAQRCHTRRYPMTVDHWLTYRGGPVGKLRMLYSIAGERILKECDASGDYAAFLAWTENDPETVIAAALSTNAGLPEGEVSVICQRRAA